MFASGLEKERIFDGSMRDVSKIELQENYKFSKFISCSIYIIDERFVKIALSHLVFLN